MTRVSSNYHTHTERCKHATGDVHAYCAAADQAGLTVLGMSDHTPLPNDQWISVRMYLSELDEYCAEIVAARAAFPDMRIATAFECEHDDAWLSFFNDVLLGEKGADYLIGAAHWFPHQGEWMGTFRNVITPERLRSYTEYLIRIIENDTYAFIAHPDVFAASYLEWDEEAEACTRAICEAAVANNKPLEINGYGLRKQKVQTPSGERCVYPWIPFWDCAAEYKLQVIANSDAHRPQDVAASIVETKAFAIERGLQLWEPDSSVW